MKLAPQENRSGLSQWLVIAVLAIAVFGCASLADACPLCKQAADQTERPAGDIASGYFWSILFMMSMPFLLLGSFSSYMYLAVRKARRELAARQSAEVPNAAHQPVGNVEPHVRETVEV